MRETLEECDARQKRFDAAKSEYAFYDTGLGRFLPDVLEKKLQAIGKMWDECLGPSRTRKAEVGNGA
jgi:hypothetical protein